MVPNYSVPNSRSRTVVKYVVVKYLVAKYVVVQYVVVKYVVPKTLHYYHVSTLLHTSIWWRYHVRAFALLSSLP